MRLFRKSKKQGGWLALVPRRDGFGVTRIQRIDGARPKVVLALHVPGERDVATLEKAGKEFRATAYHCTTLLGGGEYQLLSVEAPNVPKDEVKTAVRWRLKDILDFPPDEATIDVLEIPVDQNAPVRPQNTMLVVAARNSVIAPRQQLFASAKVPLAAIDIPEMAQRNIAALLEPAGRGLAMLSFDEDGGMLTVTYSGELYLSRKIDVPLAQLLDDDLERKHQVFDRVTLELQRSLDNFERQFSFINVARLVLAPSAVTGLDEYLSSNLYTAVDTLDLSTILDLDDTPHLADKAEQQSFFLALGAALREEGQAA